MAQVKLPLLSMYASGKVGELVFDRRGFVRLKGNQKAAHTPAQGDTRQAMIAAQSGVKVCGPATRELVKVLAEDDSRWSALLLKKMIGKKLRAFKDNQAAFQALAPSEQDGWQKAAAALKIEEVDLGYAAAGPITPGAQLFSLARTLYALDIHLDHGDPAAGNADGWQSAIAA